VIIKVLLKAAASSSVVPSARERAVPAVLERVEAVGDETKQGLAVGELLHHVLPCRRGPGEVVVECRGPCVDRACSGHCARWVEVDVCDQIWDPASVVYRR
jgi:hypothetical protein